MIVIRTTAGFLREDKDDVMAKFLLFLLSPLLGFIYSLKRINTKSSFIIFFLFSLCFGMCFTPSKCSMYIDGQNYQELFLESININNITFENKFKEYITFNSDEKDIYAEALSFYISRISNNYHLFFFVASIIFSFFQLKTFKYLVKEKEFDNSYISLILCYLFVYITIFNINGIRFWTGYWVAMFALFKIFRDNNYKYIILLVIATLFHGSLWILLALVVVTILTKKYYNIWIMLYFVSFFIGHVAFSIIGEITEYLPTFLQNFANDYTTEAQIERITSKGTGFSFIGIFLGYLIDIFFFLAMMIIISNKEKIIKDSRTKNIFGLLLVLITFANFVSTVPSLGARFVMFTYPLIAYIFLLCIKDYKKMYSLLIAFVPLYFFMRIYQTLKLYIETLNIDFFISSPIYLLSKYLLF